MRCETQKGIASQTRDQQTDEHDKTSLTLPPKNDDEINMKMHVHVLVVFTPANNIDSPTAHEYW